jgi:hypothetical protein
MAVANLTHPMAFFSQHLQTWVPQICQTLRTHLAAFFWPRCCIHRSFSERGNAGLRFGGLIEIFNISTFQFEIFDEAS